MDDPVVTGVPSPDLTIVPSPVLSAESYTLLSATADKFVGAASNDIMFSSSLITGLLIVIFVPLSIDTIVESEGIPKPITFMLGFSCVVKLFDPFSGS